MRSRSAPALLKVRGLGVRRGMGAASVTEAWRRPDLVGLRMALAQRWGRLYEIPQRGEKSEIPVIGVWPVVTGRRIRLTEKWLAIIGSRLHFTGSRIPVIGNRLPLTEIWISVTEIWFSVTESWLPVTGNRLSVTGSRLSMIGIWILVTEILYSVIGIQL